MTSLQSSNVPKNVANRNGNSPLPAIECGVVPKVRMLGATKLSDDAIPADTNRCIKVREWLWASLSTANRYRLQCSYDVKKIDTDTVLSIKIGANAPRRAQGANSERPPIFRK